MSAQSNGTAKQQAYSALVTSRLINQVPTAPSISRNSVPVPCTLYHNDGDNTIASSHNLINTSTSNNQNIIGNAHYIIGSNNYDGYKISTASNSMTTGNSIQYYPNYSNSTTTIASSGDTTNASAYRNLSGYTYQQLYQNPLYVGKLQNNTNVQHRYTQSPLEIENDKKTKKWLDIRRIKKGCKELDLRRRDNNLDNVISKHIKRVIGVDDYASTNHTTSEAVDDDNNHVYETEIEKTNDNYINVNISDNDNIISGDNYFDPIQDNETSSIILDSHSSDHDIESEFSCELVSNEISYSIPIEYKSFDIVRHAMQFYQNIKAKFDNKNINNHDKFSVDSPYSTKEAIEKIIYFVSVHNLNEKTVKNLNVLLSDLLPNANWPIRKSNNSTNVQLILEDYIMEDYRTIIFEICPNFCISYVGDFSNLFTCPKCNENRYSKCKKCRSITDCTHMYVRTPLRRVWYRPLILLMHDLLETDNFYNAINYECDSDKKYFRSDIRTGDNYKKHYKDMTKKFYDKNNPDLIMVNLLISEFYDGIQLFKSKVQNFWPLMISILNLPLSMRIKLGVGTFLISLYTGKLNKPTERFVLEECLAEELKQFYHGIEINKNGKTYFVQIRMISTILDTKGFEETMHVQGTGSYAGCFLCNIGRGFQLGGSCKHVPILGHRVALEVEHVLRSIGQSQNCCPNKYYEINNEPKVKEKYHESISDSDEDSNNENEIDDSDSLNTYDDDDDICELVKSFNFSSLKSINDYKNKLTCLELSNDKFDELMNFMRGKSNFNEWTWYHGYSEKRFSYKHFINNLWYPHCDYRTQKFYKKRSTKSYYDDATKLFDLKKIKKSTKHFNGVKDVWHLHRLPYADIETDLCWDPFHTFFNVAKNILKNWKDERYDQYNIPFCKDNQIHYYLYSKPKNVSTLSTNHYKLSNNPKKKLNYQKLKNNQKLKNHRLPHG